MATRTPARFLADLFSRGRAAVKAYAGSTYESASHNRRTTGWRPPSATPNAAILNNLTTLRDRSRSATRNDGYAKGAIDKLVSNIIGTGIKPLSQSADPEFRKAFQALWLLWTDESDADGLLDWYGQTSQACRAWLEGGEVFVRMRPRLASDGLSVPLQIQVIEPELCPHTYNQTLPNGNRIRAGIEFNGIGRRVAYWFYPSRPGDLQDFDPSQLRRVPAEMVVHLFNPLRPGQLRGIPHLTQALIRLLGLDKYDDAVLLRQELSNLFVAFVTKQNPSSDAEETNPLTGLAVETSAEGDPLTPLEPGIFQELAPGEDVKFSEPPGADNTYVDFNRQQLYHICAAAGVPYETLTGDMKNVNDRTVRVILQEFRRTIMAWQHQIIVFQLCRIVLRAWMDRAYLSGALPIPDAYATDPTPWLCAKWMPQGWPYLQPVQDVQAKQMEVRAGFASRSSVVSENGEDAEQIDAEQFADNKRADELGLSYESDGRVDAAAIAPPAPDGDSKPAGEAAAA